jgi:hypothetical protein
MLIKPRRVRRSSKFTSRLQTGSRQRREYAASVYTMAVVKAILAIAMMVLSVRAYQMMHAHRGDMSLALKLALPAVILLAALLVFRSCVKNVQSVREISQYRRTPRGR